MFECRRCATVVPDDARFCSSCGSELGRVAPSPHAETIVDSQPSAHGIATPFPSIQGFAPGEVLAGRYRVVGLLGRGGMGEVYRADDLKLGAPVALKFLPRASGRDPSLIQRFHAEVRTARQVSHPHVCRVYDIGEIGGRHFLSMEYVDGEDLGTLLRRIGRLPPAKAIEIARQLAVGLAAAHEKGVLHRDLKPANVMIDGHGRARITDFGLAVLADSAPAEFAGTPAYMAPEQLEGRPATIQSDIYALGLVIYELFTGKRPFEAGSFLEWKRVRSESVVPSPSSHTTDMDPVVERVVLRCLENDPIRRPRTAAQVALALPGGDPLAAALAAGETPSPEMVAATGGEGALTPARAWTALGTFLALLVALMILVPASTDLGLAPMEKSPDVLRARAREIVRELGYTEKPRDEATWLRRDYGPIRWLADHTISTEWRRRLREMGAPVLMVYRRSASPLIPIGAPGRVTVSDPAPTPGDIFVAVDSDGRLRELHVTPGGWSAAFHDTVPFPDAMVFRQSGLDPSRFVPVTPERVPRMAFHERKEWIGTRVEAPEISLRLSAATFGDRLVSVVVSGPWAERDAANPLTDSISARVSATALAVFIVFVLVAGAIFARRNIRLGRGDRRGAFRVAAAGFVLSLAQWLVTAHHVFDWGSILENQQVAAVGEAVLHGAFLWLVYMALEPYLRRRMPDLLVGWARVLDGRLRDPRVGRDVLVGLVAGAFFAATYHLVNGLPTWIPFSHQTTIPTFGVRDAARIIPLAAPFSAASDAIERTLTVLMLLFVVRLFTSRVWIAIAVLTVVNTLLGLGGENFALETPQAVVTSLVIALTVVRFGPLALGVLWFSSSFMIYSAIRADLSLWYAPYAIATWITLLGLGVWSFRIALGGRPAMGRVSLDI
jgi:hypothetical protein